MNDFNASGNIRLSREMYTALFKNQQASYLVDAILADGKVNPSTSTREGQSDAAALGKLRAHLEAAARAGDKKLSPEETALLNALDAGSSNGASADVVLKNLTKIQELQKQVGEQDLDPAQISFEFDLLGQTYTEKLHNESHTIKMGPEAAPQPSGGACQATPGATNIASLPLVAASVCADNFEEDMAHEHLISPVRIAQDRAVDQLKHEADHLMELLKKPAQTPDSKLRKDLTLLADCVENDNAYVRQVLDSLGMNEAMLTKKGILKPGDPDGKNNERLTAFLTSKDFSDKLTPAALNGYRKLLTDTLSNYIKNPATAQYDQLREIIYDHSYVFESPEGVGEEACAQYKQLKQTILNVSQQTNLLDKINNPENLPKSMQELTGDLSTSQAKAQNNTLKLAGQIQTLLGQIEANPELFPGVDCSELRNQLESLVARDDAGKLTGVKNPPPGQEHLTQLNQIWAEIEAVGIKAGLGDNFSAEGALSQAIEKAVAKNPAAAQDPAVKLLQAAPELAEYGDLLNKLNKPENKPLLEALLKNQGAEVSKYFSEYSTRYFDLDSIFSGAAGAAASVANGFSLGGIGGAIAAGVSFTSKWLTGTSTASGTGSSPLGSSSTDTSPGSSLSNFSFNNLTFANAYSFKPQLNFSSGANPVQTPNLNLLPGQGLDLGVTAAPSGKNMSLFGMSQTDVEAVMKLLAENPAAKDLIQAHGSNLDQLIQASPAAAELNTAIAAKQAFNSAFWASNSGLEGAQASVQAAMNARSQAEISLTQAEIAVRTALEADNLAPEDKRMTPEVRQLLATQQSQLEAGLKAIQAGEPLPQATPALDSTIAAVRDARLVSSGVTASEAVVIRAQKLLTSQTVDPLLQELSAAFDNGQMQQLLDKLPPDQRDQLKSMATTKDGQLSSEKLLNRIRRSFDDSFITPVMAQQLTSNLQALTGLLRKANEPGTDAASLAAYGKQVLDTKAPLPGSAFDLLSDMQFLQESMRDLHTTVGKDQFHELANRFVTDSIDIMQKLTEQNPDQPVDRTELHARMREKLGIIKNDTLKKSMLDGLKGEAPKEIYTAPLPDQQSMTAALTGNLDVQQRLQDVFSAVGANLKDNPAIKPLLDKLAKGNTAVMPELEALLNKGGADPTSLTQEITALLNKHLPPEDAKKLQAVLIGEISKKLGDIISEEEKAIGDFSRTDSIQAQQDLVSALQAYQGIMAQSLEKLRSDGRFDQAGTLAAQRISYNAGQLLSMPKTRIEGVTTNELFSTVFPSLDQQSSDDELLAKELGDFLSLTKQQLQEKLEKKTGKKVELSDEQMISIKLALASFATGRYVKDSNRGPAACALSKLVQQTIDNPAFLDGKHDQLKALMMEAGNIKDAAGRDAFLAKIALLSPEAAQAGKAMSTTLTTHKALDMELNAAGIKDLTESTQKEKVDPAELERLNKQLEGPPVIRNDPKVDGTPTTDGNKEAPISFAVTMNALRFGMDHPPDVNPNQPNQKGNQLPEFDPVKVPQTYKIESKPLSTEAENSFWRKSTAAYSNAFETFLSLSRERQLKVKELPGMLDFTNNQVKSYENYEKICSKENSICQDIKTEWQKKMKIYDFMSKEFAKLLNSDPNIVNEMMSKIIDRLKPKHVTTEEQLEEIKAKAEALAQKMLAPQPETVNSADLGKDVMDFINSIREQDIRVQQLALVQLAQKMITGAIHIFYDKKAQESNKHHFQTLQKLAENFHSKIEAELRQSLVTQSGHAPTTSGGDAGQQSEALNQALRGQLDSMLEATQQMHPPMLTDFKRHQILQALFDKDPSNDLQGIMLLAGAHPQN